MKAFSKGFFCRLIKINHLFNPFIVNYISLKLFEIKIKEIYRNRTQKSWNGYEVLYAESTLSCYDNGK